jgi:hypothetical protein
MKIDLPSGAWMDLLRPDTMRSKHIRQMTKSVSDLGDGRRVGANIVDLNDGVAAILVQDWNCTGSDGEVLPIPSEDLESLDDMDPDDYLILINHEWIGVVQQKIFTLMGERVTPDDHADPDSPSAPSVESGLALRAAPSPRKKTAAPAGTKRRATSGGPRGTAGPLSK